MPELVPSVAVTVQVSPTVPAVNTPVVELIVLTQPELTDQVAPAGDTENDCVPSTGSATEEGDTRTVIAVESFRT